MNPNQGDMNPEDYGGNSPDQNDNEKGYQNQEYMADYNDNTEYFKNSIYMGGGENQYYQQNMDEDREGMDYPQDESIDQEQKFVSENTEEGQRHVEEDEFAEDELDEEENIHNEGKEDEEFDENEEINESERYDYESKGKKSKQEGESIQEKSMNDDEEQREGESRRSQDEGEGEEGQDEDNEEAHNEDQEEGQNEEGEKKEGEEQENADAQEDKGENEGEEGKQGEGEGTEEKKEEKNMGMPEKRRPGKPSNKQRLLNMQKEMAGPALTEEERIQISIESARRFNNKVMNNRLKLKVHMKQLEKNKYYENIPIELASAPFPSMFVPLYMYDANGSEYFSMNQATQIERAQMGKFKRMNVENEGVTLVPEQFSSLGMYPGRKFQRKKRKRPPPPVKPQTFDDSD